MMLTTTFDPAACLLFIRSDSIRISPQSSISTCEVATFHNASSIARFDSCSSNDCMQSVWRRTRRSTLRCADSTPIHRPQTLNTRRQTTISNNNSNSHNEISPPRIQPQQTILCAPSSEPLVGDCLVVQRVRCYSCRHEHCNSIRRLVICTMQSINAAVNSCSD